MAANLQARGLPRVKLNRKEAPVLVSFGKAQDLEASKKVLTPDPTSD